MNQEQYKWSSRRFMENLATFKRKIFGKVQVPEKGWLQMLNRGELLKVEAMIEVFLDEITPNPIPEKYKAYNIYREALQ